MFVLFEQQVRRALDYAREEENYEIVSLLVKVDNCVHACICIHVTRFLKIRAN